MTTTKRNAREDILNTAERLFAVNGVANVSLRTINAEAGYSAAALHYHFKTKANLLEALLIDRHETVMAVRAELIASLQQNDSPDTMALAQALVMPLAHLILNDHDRGLLTVKLFFQAYIDRTSSTPAEQITEDSLNIFTPLLAKALPGLSEEARRIRWLIATETAFQGLANMDAILSSTSKKIAKASIEEYIHSLIEFIAGGLKFRSRESELHAI